MKYIFYIIISLIFIEFILRYSLGLGYPMLYEKDNKAGYVEKANQDLHRFGNWIYINKYHQRSSEISPENKYKNFRIMAVGDSITFGLTLVDQRKVWPSLVADFVEKCINHPTDTLNVSAGGWAIDNELGYLEEFGFFKSDLVIFEIGSNDFLQPKAEYVDDEDYPSSNPFSATTELVHRYLIWRYLSRWENSDHTNSIVNVPHQLRAQEGAQFRHNLGSLYTELKMADRAHCRVLVLHIPELNEVCCGHDQMNRESRQLFIKMLKKEHVPIINFYAEWMDEPDIKSYYHDKIHLSKKGNDVVAHRIEHWICQQTWDSLNSRK